MNFCHFKATEEIYCSFNTIDEISHFYNFKDEKYFLQLATVISINLPKKDHMIQSFTSYATA